MKYYLILLLIFVAPALYGQQKEVCFTIDDLPVVHYGKTDEMYLWDITLDLIATFDKYEIPAIGFVNERKLYRNGELDETQLDLLKMWFQNGYDIGNHTYSHGSYHKIGFEEYTQDVIKGEAMSRKLAPEFNKEIKYFRHPFLHVGLDLNSYEALNSFLKKNGYTVAPVSIDNADYLFAKAYHDALESDDQGLVIQIGEDYINYMEQKVLFFEGQSEKLFGRNISQILLLHANKLNADLLDELAEMFLNNGYKFVSLDMALQDEAYQSEVTKFGNWGISWIDRWALSQGKSGDFFKGDPDVPDYIK